MKKNLYSERFRWEGIHCAPIVHSRYYFALWIQRLFDEIKPDLIAVEFPNALKDLVVQGAERLPYLSAVCASPDGETYSYIPLDPCDGIVHAVRLGEERGLPVHFIDLNRMDIAHRPRVYTPDDYALNSIGAETFYEKTIERTPLSEPESIDYLREQHMAARLRHLNGLERRVLFVCGMSHWEQIRGFLESGGGFEYFNLEEPDAESFLANVHPDSAADFLEEVPAIAGRFEPGRHVGRLDRSEEALKILLGRGGWQVPDVGR